MRIGIVSDYYRPWPGGISEHVHHEADELRRRGHEVKILTGPLRRGEVADRPGEADVIRIGRDIRFTNNGAKSRIVYGTYMARFRSILRALRIDLLHAHAPLDPFLAPLAIHASEVATVGTFHSSFEPSPLWDTLFGRMQAISKAVFDRIDVRIAVSPEAERCIAHYFPAEYTVIPNGVDTERFSPDVKPLDATASPSSTPGRPTILFVGRADPRKGLQHLLAAFVDVRRRVEGARLVVVGVERPDVEPVLARLDPAVRSALRSALDHDISFEGYVSAEALPHFYAGCQVFCSAATGQESQGIVLLEAMAAARPPVAFDIRGYRDVVTDGHDGALVEKVAGPALADALCELLANPSRCAEMGRAGRDTALRYAWPRVVDCLEEQFELALARRASTPRG